MFVILKKMNSFYVNIYSHGDNIHSLYRFTIYSPVIDHPRCEDLLFAYRRRSFTKIEPQEISSGNSSRQIYLWEQILLHAFCSLRICVVPCCLSLLTFYAFSEWSSTYSEQKGAYHASTGRLQEVKKGKLLMNEMNDDLEVAHPQSGSSST